VGIRLSATSTSICAGLFRGIGLRVLNALQLLSTLGWTAVLVCVAFLFPEAARSRDGGVGPFKGGVSWLARETGIPILPIAMDGSGDGPPSAGSRGRRGRIRLRAGTLIATAGLALSDRQGQAARGREAIIARQRGPRMAL
jgi:hypothetical protein